MYDCTKETEVFNHIHFVKEFKYLGTTINYMLDNTVDIKHQITQVSKAVGALSSL